MCGIVGVISPSGDPVIGLVYEALLALQHRGQDAAGIVTEDAGRLCLHKDNGMVRDVFGPEQLRALRGDVGIGHVRYPTAGTSSCAEAQPFYVNSPYGITLGHNGNLTNAPKLQHELLQELRHINTGSDSEVLLNVFASELLSILTQPSSPRVERVDSDDAPSPGPDGAKAAAAAGVSTTPTTKAASPAVRWSHLAGVEAMLPTEAELVQALRAVLRRCVGGYAVVAMVTGYGLLAFRDPHGIRPLSYGRRRPVVETPPSSGAPSPSPGAASPAGDEWEYMVSSESAALTSLGFELIGDVPPGHALLLPRAGGAKLHNVMPEAPKPLAPCVFEYVYFARPDTVLDGVSVYRTRLRMGEYLARQILDEWKTHDIDVVVPIPDTARTAALECASVLGLKYREGFMKNRYVGRTFIMPVQGLRKKSVRQKLSAIQSEFNGRNVLLVDDSIVRGTTSTQIIAMAREAGAKKVYIASAAPPVRHPNVYGIDMPTKAELVATARDDDAIAAELGADRVIYQRLDDLKKSVSDEAAEQGVPFQGLDCSCFDGVYVTGLGGDYLTELAQKRGGAADAAPSSACHLLDRLAVSAASS